jgi:hypothetical protein
MIKLLHRKRWLFVLFILFILGAILYMTYMLNIITDDRQPVLDYKVFILKIINFSYSLSLFFIF